MPPPRALNLKIVRSSSCKFQGWLLGIIINVTLWGYYEKNVVIFSESIYNNHRGEVHTLQKIAEIQGLYRQRIPAHHHLHQKNKGKREIRHFHSSSSSSLPILYCCYYYTTTPPPLITQYQALGQALILRVIRWWCNK